MPAAFLLDLAGTLYSDSGPIAGAVETVLELRRRGIPHRFVTNTSSRGRGAIVERLRNLGLDDQQILSTVLITCVFNFMTRLADGLGVEIQENRVETAKRWMSSDVQAMSWLMDHKEK